MNLAKKIKSMLNLADCMLKTYYHNIIVKCYGEGDDFMEVELSADDLIEERDLFAMDEDFSIEMDTSQHNLVVTLR